MYNYDQLQYYFSFVSYVCTILDGKLILNLLTLEVELDLPPPPPPPLPLGYYLSLLLTLPDKSLQLSYENMK